MVTPGLPEINVIGKKGDEVIVFVYGSPTKFYHVISIYYWSGYGNFSISTKDVIITSVLKGFDQKKIWR